MQRLRNPDQNGSAAKTTLYRKFCPALALLLDAIEYAEQTNGQYWEFAVEIQQLQETGLTSNDLRFLVRKGLVEHASETTLSEQDGRSFQPTGDLTFRERSCFILTPNGVVAASQSCPSRSENGAQLTSRGNSTVLDTAPRHCVPSWDAERRVLRFDSQVVKHFKWRAVNQEAILAAFEEEGWPVRVDDPLPPEEEQDSKRRLSDTIKCLNRKQKTHVLHFRGDGTGEGVTWEQVGQVGSNGQCE